MLFNKRLMAVLFAFVISLIALPLSAQTVRGRVLDTKSQPIPGAVVMGGGLGVMTGADGSFEINLRSGATELEVSCLGYVSKKVSVTGAQDNLEIRLADDALHLEETVVIGYGTTKKVNLTGAISTVESEQLENRTANTLTHMLQGSVPGLLVTTNSGQPDEKPDINIRGLMSLNSGAGPLVLIDGSEGNLSQVNPNDVESISVIKDGSSAAVFGVRGAYGVILITTKSGFEDGGKPKVRYSGNVGVSLPTTSTDYIRTGYDHATITDLFYFNMTGTKYTKYTDADMEELKKRRNDLVENPSRPWEIQEVRDGVLSYIYYCNTDWYHEMFVDESPTTQHSFTVSGGDSRMQYFLSGGYKHRQGTYKQRAEQYNRYNVRTKMNVNLNKWLSVSNNLSFYASDYDYPGNATPSYNWSYASVHGLSCFPLKNKDGSWVYSTILSPVNLTNGCHIDLGQDTKVNKSFEHNLTNTVEASIHPIPGLDIRGNFTYRMDWLYKTNRWTNMTYSKYPGKYLQDKAGRFSNHLEETRSRDEYMSTNLYASYEKSFAEKHNLKAVVGFNYEQEHYAKVYTDGHNLSSMYLTDYNLVQPGEDGQKVFNIKGGQHEYAVSGLFARINYDYKGKYLFEVSTRRDGTSRWLSETRYGFFPAASIGWKFSDEVFMSGIKDVLNYGKIRFAYGQLGNQSIGSSDADYYTFVRLMNIRQAEYLFESETSFENVGSAEAPIGDKGLHWEVAKQYNLGFDLGFLNNRLSVSTEGYFRDTEGMITSGLILPSAYGTTAPRTNGPNLRTKGIELTMSWKDSFSLLGRPFDYGATVTYNDYYTVITKFETNPGKLIAGYYPGKKLGDIWGYKTDGLFQTDKEALDYTSEVNCSLFEEHLPGGWKAGDLKFLDLNGDGVVNKGMSTVDDCGDYRIIGNSQPRYQYGVTLSASWYGFDLSAFFQGIGRMDWYPPADNRNFWFCYTRPSSTWIPKDFMKQVWSEDNKDAYFPRPAAGDGKQLGYLKVANDRYLQNIGYLRFKNLTIGYTIPKRLVQKAGVAGVRVYFTGENIAYWSPIKKYDKYIDPENAKAEGNSWTFAYPWQKNFTVGVDIDF